MRPRALKESVFAFDHSLYSPVLTSERAKESGTFLGADLKKGSWHLFRALPLRELVEFRRRDKLRLVRTSARVTEARKSQQADERCYRRQSHGTHTRSSVG